MSLVRIALRIAAVEALKGRTLVGDNVLDSEIGSLQVNSDGSLRTDEDCPFITVYTDSASTKGQDNAQRAMALNGATEILFEAGITASMTELDPATDESRLVGIGIPATDRAFEWHLDMVARQIGDALTDPDNAWAQVYQGLIHTIVSTDRARTSGTNDGVRLAGHQIKVAAQLITDPVCGAEIKPQSAIGRFFSLCETLDDPVLKTQAQMMRAQIAGHRFTWQQTQQRYGLTRTERDALLLTPLVNEETMIDDPTHTA